MDNICEYPKGSKASGSDDTDVSTPKDFSNEENEPMEIADQEETENISFNERIRFAKEHLQRIEQRKQIIDRRQVILFVFYLCLLVLLRLKT